LGKLFASASAPSILLISPGLIKWTDLDFGLPHLVSIGGYLRQHLGIHPHIIDLSYEGGDHHHLLRRIDELGEQLLIGISCYSSFDYMRVLSLARFLRGKYPKIPMIGGGYHASALPMDLLFAGSPFDAVVVGEGEKPMREITETLLGGNRLTRQIYGPDNIADLDELPPYQWDLLDRYWPRAHSLGSKLQIYLSRGCPYRCTFCMERAKADYRWRAYSPERALDELQRLAARTDLSRWIVNIADPLFGFSRKWRRAVLSGIIERDLIPRQYWTLTRSDDLDDCDVQLLAEARFSIGIGAESASHRMLLEMQKVKHPENYLAAIERLASSSRRHGLNWAANLIIGHPGEDLASMRESSDFLQRLFASAADTCGWLSFDPFRLYPGSAIYAEMERYEQQHGTRFYAPQWWRSWYDGAFRSEHIDPSHSLDYETRVRFMYDTYAPIAQDIQRRFRGQDRPIDRVFTKSLAEQARLLSPQMRDQLLASAARAKRSQSLVVHSTRTLDTHGINFPIGLQIKDPSVRRREEAVRLLLEEGVLRTEALIEAFLSTSPEQYLSEAQTAAMLTNAIPPDLDTGKASPWLGIRICALSLEALEPSAGDLIAQLTPANRYITALLSKLVAPSGQVIAPRYVDPTVGPTHNTLAKYLYYLLHWQSIPSGGFDRLWIGGAMPRFSPALRDILHQSGGRAVTFLGPRFKAQDLVCLTRRASSLEQRIIARAQVPILAGREGWLRP
jgi:radical SAM superfamily enzyme YgiQ (UPF0313 family)/protein-L-isoaspartate O-methyltransferase